MNMLISSLVVLVSAFVLVFTYPLFSYVLLEEFIPTINDTVENHSLDINMSVYRQVTSNIQMSWIVGPVIFMVGLIVFLFLMTSKKEYSREYV